MTLQQKTLQKYRQLFPNDTLRVVSDKTGIQMTRVFRLFNGKTMKVGELEAFEKIISDKLAENPSYARLNDVMENASTLLSNEELAKVADYISRKVVAKNFGKFLINTSYESAVIA